MRVCRVWAMPTQSIALAETVRIGSIACYKPACGVISLTQYSCVRRCYNEKKKSTCCDSPGNIACVCEFHPDKFRGS